MPRKGSKTITINDKDHEFIRKIGQELNLDQKEIVTFAIYETFLKDEENTIVGGFDINLIFEDVARLTRRVSQLENDKETLVRFIRGKFPKDANKLTKLLNTKSDNTRELKSSEYSIFGQEDSGLTTEQAISRCLLASPVSVDPISTISPAFSKQKGRIPEFN